MAEERSPFEFEQQLGSETEKELVAALAAAFVFATGSIIYSQFNPDTDFETIQQRFRNKFSETLPYLSLVSQQSITNDLERSPVPNSVSVDNSQFNKPEEVFNENLIFIISSNLAMYQLLRQIAIEREWTNEQLARRLKSYYGLTAERLKSVLLVEMSLLKENTNKKLREQIIQNKIDSLVDWRLRLIATRISTGVIEGSKDAAYEFLAQRGQINSGDYEKIWRSVVDENTTNICLNSNNMTAPLGGTFNNGLRHPPAFPPVHNCRSSITIRKRRL